MKQRRRIYYTDSQKAVMWERWRKGESLQQIAQLFDRNHSSVQRILAEHRRSSTAFSPPNKCSPESGGHGGRSRGSRHSALGAAGVKASLTIRW